MENLSFTISNAGKKNVSADWNLIWDKNLYQIQHHRLYYIWEGNGEVILNDRTIALKQNKVYFFPAYTIIKTSCPSFMKQSYIHFQSNFLPLNNFFYYSKTNELDKNEMTQYLFDTVLENYSSVTHTSIFKANSALNLIISDFLDKMNLSIFDNKNFFDIIHYIEKNYTQPLTVESLAQMHGYNTVYFSNTFKKIFGISPKQYIINRRLTESMILLQQTDYNINEIAFRIGFENPNYFSEQFHLKMKMAPTRFRGLNKLHT